MRRHSGNRRGEAVPYNPDSVRLDDFDYPLPPELVAQHPPARRGESRLLRLDGPSGRLEDRTFNGLPGLIAPGDVVVFNDTRVINARLFAAKPTGGHVEMLVERVLDDHHALVQMRASKPVRPGTVLQADGGARVTVLDRLGGFHRVELQGDESVLTLLDRVGKVPLPPYIQHPPDATDAERYQTVYARNPGAVAAPTAGLHFDQAMIDAVAARGAHVLYLTLHVGAGTFQPVRVEQVHQHVMHSEWYSLSAQAVERIRAARASGGRLLAVGTTTLRALEAAAAAGELVAGSGETNLFILPGYRFRVVDRLLTNFHLPRSTLMMLVSAFGGHDQIRAAYAHAVAARYRFFSYGDAMLIERRDREAP